MKVSDIRELIAATLTHLGLSNCKSQGHRILCRNGFCIGMRFVFEGVSAIWLGDVAEIRFVNDEGDVLKVVPLSGMQLAPIKVS